MALDLLKVSRLDFQEPDYERFPCLTLASQAMEKGGTAPAILNAANEVAVEAFLEGRLEFTGIPRVVQKVLEQVSVQIADDLRTVLESDKQARRVAEQIIHGQDTKVGIVH